MDLSNAYKVSSSLFIVAVKIRNMLEIIAVDITGLYNLIGLYIILKYSYLKIISLLCKDGLCCLKDFCMGTAVAATVIT